jgi:hypothetical protein
MNLTPVLIVVVVFFGVYKLFELFVHRKERTMLIEKIENLNPTEIPEIKLSSASGKYAALRGALLAMGIGLGFIVGFMLRSSGLLSGFEKESQILYFACICLFGGLGLLVSYFIESRVEK